MAILTGDINLLASKIMEDVPNGGGGPTGTVIPDGVSNAVFGDVTERQRAGGGVSIRQVFLAVKTPDTAAYMDPTIIVSRPPNDPNVSITLAKCSMFAERTEIANSIENYLIQASEWSGYLLENHVVGQRSIQLFQRPGTAAPTIGRTLVLIQNEGLAGQKLQYVRVTRTETTTATFTGLFNGSNVDFAADVVQCDLTDALRIPLTGSPPSRLFSRQAGRAVVRDTTVADAAQYFGSSPTTLAAALGDSTMRVASVYTQLVPSDRSEVTALNQRPAAVRQLQLATAPREINIGAAAHAYRIKIGQENRGFSFVQILKPFPAPNSVAVSWMALGTWYTLTDDGAGNLTGTGVGTVDYATGNIAITLTALPDVGSAIIFQWGEKSAFVNRSGSVSFRAPEYALKLDHAGIVPGTLTLGWTSGNVARTATDNGTGLLTGAAVGEINYASGDLFIRPTQMLDAGGEFQIGYQHATIITKNATVTPDVGGFASIVLDTVPAAGSVTVSWITVREVSNTGGASAGGTASAKETTGNTSTVMGRNPDFTPPVAPPAAQTPVSITRVAVGNSTKAAAPHMAPAGTRAANGDNVFIRVSATYDPVQGWYYPVPDAAGVSWTEEEINTGTRAIGGITYNKWGFNTTWPVVSLYASS
jgi:hypothetical protein